MLLSFSNNLYLFNSLNLQKKIIKWRFTYVVRDLIKAFTIYIIYYVSLRTISIDGTLIWKSVEHMWTYLIQKEITRHFAWFVSEQGSNTCIMNQCILNIKIHMLGTYLPLLLRFGTLNKWSFQKQLQVLIICLLDILLGLLPLHQINIKSIVHPPFLILLLDGWLNETLA